MRSLVVAVSVLFLLLSACADPVQPNSKAETILEDSLRSKGDSLIAISFDTLRNSLIKAVGEQGFDGAVAFCKLNAAPLLAIYASNDVQVTRNSSRLRNPENAADSLGMTVLASFQKEADKGQQLRPQLLLDDDGNYRYYKPIAMQPFCLNCHGSTSENIAAATLDSLKQLYPSDAAVNYKDGELRGMWYVLFKQPSPKNNN